MINRRKKQSYNYKLLGGILIATLVLIAIIIIMIVNLKPETSPVDFNNSISFEGYDDDEIIPEGVYIGPVDVGNMSRGEAKSALNKIYSKPENLEVVVYWEENAVKTTLDNLGVTWGINKAIDNALDLKYGGGLIQRYKSLTSLSDRGLHLEIAKTLDREKVLSFIKSKISKVYDIEPVNAKFVMDDGLDIIEGKPGKVTNINKTIGDILNIFHNIESEKQIIVKATVDKVEPSVSKEYLKSHRDVLGKFTTTYLKRDGRERTDRCINVEVATAYINGLFLKPGQSASASDMMKERIVENGYAMGGQFINGQLEDAVGGGVCQVATTLYNALIRAEIQIDKRYNHSALVSYVDPSEDAAIATGSKDLVFTNNLENPIYVFGYTDGHDVTFTIYGSEYRDSSRRVEFESVEEKRIKSEDNIIEDYDMFVGEKKTVGATHDECWSRLEKVIYENGKEVSREVVHKDYYLPSVAKVYIGKKEKPTEAVTPTVPTSSVSVP